MRVGYIKMWVDGVKWKWDKRAENFRNKYKRWKERGERKAVFQKEGVGEKEEGNDRRKRERRRENGGSKQKKGTGGGRKKCRERRKKKGGGVK